MQMLNLQKSACDYARSASKMALNDTDLSGSQQVTVIYSFLFDTSHVALGDMPDFFQKHVWITRHAIPFTQRPG